MAITKIQSESLNLADDFAFTGTITGAGGVNTPAFYARRTGSNQSIGDNVLTKAQFNTKDLDTNNCYDNSTNYRFTPNVAGKYYVFSMIRSSSDDSLLYESYMEFKKNGTFLPENTYVYISTGNHLITINAFAIVEMNGTTDYLEVFARMDRMTNNSCLITSGSNFGGYKIIT